MTLKAGRHEVTVIGAEPQVSSNNTAGILFTYEDAAGERISDSLWFTDRTKERNGKTLTMLGFDPFKEASWAQGYGVMLGAKCQIVVEDEEYKGKWRQRVKWINEPGGKNEWGESDAFAAAMRIFGVGSSTSPASATPAPVEEDDDVPF